MPIGHLNNARMTNRIGPQASGQAHPKPLAAYSLPTNLAEVALIDAPTCAAVGKMSLSWWHDQVRVGRAPQPVIRKPRCTRWRLSDVRAFWLESAKQVQREAEAAPAVKAQAKKASAAAQAKRAAATAGAGL